MKKNLYQQVSNFILLIILMLFINSTVRAEEFAATLQWSKRVRLSTPVSGVVQKVFSVSGNIAAKGEVLVQLDSRSYKADLKYAKAKLTNADEVSQEAKRELDRQTDMYERTMLSDHDLQVAKNNFTSAQSQYLQAQSSLTKARLNLEYSAIRAPFNAVVIRTIAVKGQVVASAVTPPILVIVAEARRMLAHFYVEMDKVNNYAVQQGVKVEIYGQVYQGKILNIALESDKTQTDHYAVDVIFDSKDTLMRAGQKVKVTLQ